MVTTATAFISVSMTKGTMKSDERPAPSYTRRYQVAAGFIGSLYACFRAFSARATYTKNERMKKI